MRPYFSTLGLLAVPALALVFSGTSRADMLAPGTFGAPDVFTLSGPTVFASTLDPFSNANETGTVEAAVISDPNNVFGAGNLDFIFQINNSSASIDGLERLVATDFTGYKTDVGYATNGSLLSSFGFSNGAIAPVTVDRPFANEVGFQFGPVNTVAPGTSSELLVIETNSDLFQPGTVAIIDGLSTNLSGFAPAGDPTPEPSMTLLVGAGLAAVVALRKRFSRA